MTFAADLAYSQSQADAPWWEQVYRQAFPDLAAAVNVRDDGWAQRAGIDRVLTLRSGKTLTVDEKVRRQHYDDIALEYWSDRDRKIRGWVAKELGCDFIAYAFEPTRVCYLLPFQTLRRAWRLNGKEWVQRYVPPIEADNGDYVTVSVGVPTRVLLDSLADAVVIRWRTP